MPMGTRIPSKLSNRMVIPLLTEARLPINDGLVEVCTSLRLKIAESRLIGKPMMTVSKIMLCQFFTNSNQVRRKSPPRGRMPFWRSMLAGGMGVDWSIVACEKSEVA